MPSPTHPPRVTLVVAAVILIAAPLALSASDRFNDVPDSNVFHDDIAWLADADVTRGCNPPANTEFCPSDNVTREQMAAFMNRLANNQVVHAATAQNAEQLDGKDPSHYETVVALLHRSQLGGSDLDLAMIEGPFEGPSLDITVPAAGTVVVQASSSWDRGTYTIASWTEVDTDPACDTRFDEDVMDGSFGLAHSEFEEWGANTFGQSSFPVDEAGTHTITLCYNGFGVTSPGGDLDHSIVATWIPTDHVTLAPAGDQSNGAGPDPTERGVLGP